MSDGPEWAGDGDSRLEQTVHARTGGAPPPTCARPAGSRPGATAPVSARAAASEPGAASARRRTAGWLLLGLGLLAIGVATGIPVSKPGLPEVGALQLWPSPPDFLRNVALFAPLGCALGLLGRRRAAVLAVCAGLSVVVETAQWSIPGRESSPWDVVANVAGGWAGLALLRHHRWLVWPPDARAARHLHRLVTAAAAIALAGGSLLLRTSLPPEPWFGHVPPDLPNLEPYGGAVLRATVSGQRLRNGQLSGTGALRSALDGDHRVVVEAVAGPPPRDLAGLALVTDDRNRGVLMVGLEGRTLLYSVRTWSHRLGMEGGRRLVAGALDGVGAGAPLLVEVRRQGRDLCVAVGDTNRCGLGFRLGEGWTHLLGEMPVPLGLRRYVDWLWLAVLLGAVGYSGRGRARDPWPYVAMAAALVVALMWGPARVPSLPEWLAAGAGLALGRLAAAWLHRLHGWLGSHPPSGEPSRT